MKKSRKKKNAATLSASFSTFKNGQILIILKLMCVLLIFFVEKVAMSNFNFCRTVRDKFPCVKLPLVPWAANFTEGFFSVVARFGCLLAGRPLHKVINKFLKMLRPFYETSQNLSFSIKANYGAFFLSTYCVF